MEEYDVKFVLLEKNMGFLKEKEEYLNRILHIVYDRCCFE